MAAQNRGPRRPSEPELMGAKEAAETLGVGQTNLRVLPDLPEPYDKVGATTLWRADEVRDLAAKRASKRKMDAILQMEAAKRQEAAEQSAA
jgi:hypothetical protein